MSAALPQYPNDAPLPWQTAEMHAAQEAADALVARARWGRDVVQALVWLAQQPVTDQDARDAAYHELRTSCTKAEWRTFRIWREGTARHYVAMVAARHARRVGVQVAA